MQKKKKMIIWPCIFQREILDDTYKRIITSVSSLPKNQIFVLREKHFLFIF
jgi:hypothetical protein